MTLITGTAAGQVVTVAATPLISRLYDPVDVGTFAVIVAVATIAASILSLRLERAVALPVDDGDAGALAALGVLAISVGSTLLLAGLLVARAAGLSVAPIFVWAVPITSALIAAVTLLNQLAIRDKWYAGVGRRNLLQPLVTAVAQVLLSFGLSNALGLVVGGIVGRLSGLPGLMRGSTARQMAIRGPAARARARALGRRYARVSALGTVAGILNTASLQLPVVLLGALFGAASAGQFAMALLVVGAPVLLLGNAIGQAYLGEMADVVRTRSGSARRLFFRASRGLAAAGAVAALIVFAAAPAAFAIILGPQWTTAGDMARAMALLLLGRLVAAPLAHTLVVLERQGAQLVLDAARLLGVVATIVIGESLGVGVVSTVAWYSGWAALTYLIQWLLCERALGGD